MEWARRLCGVGWEVVWSGLRACVEWARRLCGVG